MKYLVKIGEKIMSEEIDYEASGWDAITKCFEGIYPGQDNPIHYGTMIRWSLGGKDPLDGISVYDGGDYWHFVTYGLSELYEKETDDEEYSGYGMEFTFKLKKYSDDDTARIRGICGILQQIARITFNSGEIFGTYEYLYTGQTSGIDPEGKSNITGFITIPDTDAKPMDTPNGKVEFVEFIGVTDAELKAIQNKTYTVEKLYEDLGTDVTSYDRESLV